MMRDAAYRNRPQFPKAGGGGECSGHESHAGLPLDQRAIRGGRRPSQLAPKAISVAHVVIDGEAAVAVTSV